MDNIRTNEKLVKIVSAYPRTRHRHRSKVVNNNTTPRRRRNNYHIIVILYGGGGVQRSVRRIRWLYARNGKTSEQCSV